MNEPRYIQRDFFGPAALADAAKAALERAGHTDVWPPAGEPAARSLDLAGELASFAVCARADQPALPVPEGLTEGRPGLAGSQF